MGLAYSPLALIVLREAAGAEQGRASSALSLTDSLGTALGTGITGAAVAASVRDTGAPLRGLLVGFAIAIGVAAARAGPERPAARGRAARPASASAVPATGP